MTPAAPTAPACNCPPAAESPEPTYALRGSDPAAFLAMLTWAHVHQALGTLSEEQVSAAYALAGAMESCALANGHDTGKALQAWTRVLSDATARIQALAAEYERSSVH
jgi:hypothetical protein